VAAVSRVHELLEAGEPEERKAVMRAFLKGVTIDKVARRAILRWCSIPRLQDARVVLVEADRAELGRTALMMS